MGKMDRETLLRGGAFLGALRSRPLQIALVAAVLLELLLFAPGALNPDSVAQYAQAVGKIPADDWHPIIMTRLWAVLNAVSPSPFNLFALQVGLAAVGAWALTSQFPVSRERLMGRWMLLGVGLWALAFGPYLALSFGFVVKDTVMAAALLAATGLIARASRVPSALNAWLSAALLAFALLLRPNAFAAVAPLAAFHLLTFQPHLRRLVVGRPAPAGLIAMALGSGLAVLGLIATPMTNRVLGARAAHAEMSLMLYDVVGVSVRSGVQFESLARIGVDQARLQTCYSTDAWDSLYFRDCTEIGSKIEQQGAGGMELLRRDWRAAVLNNSLAYLNHRTAHMLRFWRVREQSLAAAAGLSLPFHWEWVTNREGGWQHVAHLPVQGELGIWRRNIATQLTERAAFELMRWTQWLPLAWLAGTVLVGFLSLRAFLRARSPAALAALALSLSALGYSALWFFASVAAQGRYHIWLVVALAAAAPLVAAVQQQRLTAQGSNSVSQ